MIAKTLIKPSNQQDGYNTSAPSQEPDAFLNQLFRKTIPGKSQNAPELAGMQRNIFKQQRTSPALPYRMKYPFISKEPPRKAVSLRDLHASNRIFFHNTAIKSHGRRQPCRGLLSCLAEKSFALKCFAVLNRRFLFAGSFEGRRNTGCISRTKSFLRTERFIQNRANP